MVDCMISYLGLRNLPASGGGARVELAGLAAAGTDAPNFSFIALVLIILRSFDIMGEVSLRASGCIPVPLWD